MAANSSASGYDCNFLSEPADSLKCLICLSVARDPRQHEECGKLFCSECIEKYGRDKPCPNCKTIGPFYKDNSNKRNILELKVKCDNVERKCEWVGTVGTLQEHVDTCKFALVPCPKECKDGNSQVKRFMRKELDEHLEKDCRNRDYECRYCGEEGTYADIIDDHDKTCPKKILPCPNDSCTATMQRQHIKEHVHDKCEFTRIPCKYRRLGCEIELKRKDMAAHEEDDKLHLHMAIDKTVELERNLDDMKAKLEDLNSGREIKFKLTDFQKKKASNEFVLSPSNYISCNGYYVAIAVDTNGQEKGQGTHVSIYGYLDKGKYDSTLKWPFTGAISFTLLNQLEDKNHHQVTAKVDEEDNLQADESWGVHTFISHSELGHNPVKNTQYLKDDTLYFRMEVKVAGHKPWLE